MTPQDALDYLWHLSVDVRRGVVLDAAGAVLAGDASLQPGPGVIEARSARHTVRVEGGPHVLEGLQRHDLEAVLHGLEATSGQNP